MLNFFHSLCVCFSVFIKYNFLRYLVLVNSFIRDHIIERRKGRKKQNFFELRHIVLDVVG